VNVARSALRCNDGIDRCLCLCLCLCLWDLLRRVIGRGWELTGWDGFFWRVLRRDMDGWFFDGDERIWYDEVVAVRITESQPTTASQQFDNTDINFRLAKAYP
jgi:hypothetical protein